MEEIIKLYKNNFFVKIFARIRFWDAPFHKIANLIPRKGTIIDLGCGEGLFTNFLAHNMPNAKFIGIEINHERVSKAAVGLKNTTFIHENVLNSNLPSADVITMIHLLHHLSSFEDQIKILKKAKKQIKPKGKIIIAEIDTKPLLKFFITWITDHFIYPWFFEHRFYSKVFFRSKKEWENIFTQLGLKFKTYSASKGKPFSHIIFECWK